MMRKEENILKNIKCPINIFPRPSLYDSSSKSKVEDKQKTSSPKVARTNIIKATSGKKQIKKTKKLVCIAPNDVGFKDFNYQRDHKDKIMVQKI
jgi:hypothetical protein